MIRYFGLRCPNCKARLRVRTEYAGRTVACKHCSQPFLVEHQDDAQLPGGAEPQLGSGEKSVPDSMPTEGAAAEMEKLREQNRLLEEAAEGAHQLRLELQSCLSALARSEEGHKRDLDKLAVSTGERDSLGAESQRKDAEIQALHAQLNERGVSAEAERWSQESALAQAELRAAQVTVEQLQARTSELEKTLAAATSSCETIELQAARDLEEARAAVEMERRELLARFHEEQETRTRAEEQYRAAAQGLQEENQRLQQEAELLRQEHEGASAAAAERQPAATRELHAENQRLRDEAALLRQEHEASSAAAAEQERAGAQRFEEATATLREQIQRLQEESTSLRQQLASAAAGESTELDLRNEITAHRARHEEVQAVAAKERRLAAERAQGLLASLEEQKAVTLRSEQAQAALQRELDAATAEVIAMREQAARLSLERVHAEPQSQEGVHYSTKERKNLEDEIDTLREEVQTLRQTLDSLGIHLPAFDYTVHNP